MSETLQLDRLARSSHADPLREAYRFLQTVVGWIALGLAPVLIAGGWFLDDNGVQGSLSAYYHTPMGGVFVGALCALALFFLSYQRRPLEGGYWGDKRLSDLACIAALGVALFPTAEHERTEWTVDRFVSLAHAVSAAVLLGSMACFCLVLFRRSTEPERSRRPEAKRRRDSIYWVSGWTIVGAIAVIALNNALGVIPSSWKPLLCLETIAVVAFGFSWLVKSEFVRFLNDPSTREETS